MFRRYNLALKTKSSIKNNIQKKFDKWAVRKGSLWIQNHKIAWINCGDAYVKDWKIIETNYKSLDFNESLRMECSEVLIKPAKNIK